VNINEAKMIKDQNKLYNSIRLKIDLIEKANILIRSQLRFDNEYIDPLRAYNQIDKRLDTILRKQNDIINKFKKLDIIDYDKQ
jgi:hypothetical protein